jgi:tRNA 2-selenouridine synthase
MAQRLTPAEFIRSSEIIPVVDVRSPKEFTQGHIPGAHNIPLFSDEERAIVGTTYTRSGNQQAVLKGLELVGPKLKDFVQHARRIAPGGDLLVHCWRGGMRSEAMAWLFNFSGIKTQILEGGYKAYRRYIRDALSVGPELKVLGGMTGSGKSEILKHLSEAGEQVIDLEALACHKGSAFGALGELEQPTTEQFENNLSKQWLLMDAKRPVWIEDESLNIGKVIIPEVFFNRMRLSDLFFIESSFDVRVQRLMRDYGQFDRNILLELISKISRRMGGMEAKNAAAALFSGNLKESVSIVLKYYDKTYSYSIDARNNMSMHKIDADEFEDSKTIALYLKTIR